MSESNLRLSGPSSVASNSLARGALAKLVG
jgi:hypothetical protein